MHKRNNRGFTIVELLIVIVIIAVLAAITIVAYNGIQVRARDNARITKIKSIERALELYKIDNGFYPKLIDARGRQTTCHNIANGASYFWGHCDRLKSLADALAPYTAIDPTSLSEGTQGNYFFWYDASPQTNYQTYGAMIFLEGSAGNDDGGYWSKAYEIGQDPKYCLSTYGNGTKANYIPIYYTGEAGDWTGFNYRCGNAN